MTSDAAMSFDDRAMTVRQRRIALTAVGGYFVDGYDLLILSGALLAITPEFGLGSATLGALTAAAFVGMSVGSFAAGPATDRYGRKLVFMTSMILFLLGSLAFLLVTQVWQLIALRFVIGVAIGADMPAASALIAEFVPSRRRGRYTSLAGVAWMLGSLVAIGVALAIYALAGLEAWRWVMATGCLSALVLIVLRHRTPESPAWLRSRGREAEARAAWRYATDHEDTFDAAAPASAALRYAPIRVLFRRPLVLLFTGICVFWFLNNMYGSAVLLYQPVLIQRILDPGTFTSLLFTAATTAVAVIIGAISCFVLIERVGRRFIALWGTAVVAVAAVAVWAFAGSAFVVLVAFAAAIGFINGGTSLAFYAWAPELFPTIIRGRAVGMVNMIGKLGSVVGTFALPVAFDAFGTAAFLLIAVACVLNIVSTYALTIETRGRSLEQIQDDARRRFGGARAPVEGTTGPHR